MSSLGKRTSLQSHFKTELNYETHFIFFIFISDQHCCFC